MTAGWGRAPEQPVSTRGGSRDMAMGMDTQARAAKSRTAQAGAAATARVAAPGTDPDEPVNEVSLRGRLPAVAEERELPSGDQIVTIRVVVPRRDGPSRPTSRGGDRRRVTVDTIDVVCWSARTRRAALRLKPDDQIAVQGALRRRFFRGPSGPQSRYEVEASALRRVQRRAPGAVGRGTPHAT
ncbi:MAG: single-stranded DNA-binding protein [Micrococcales bacterium]|nr:single-stranded DNA-binding protein [Micrococcales bacterium]